FKQTGISIADIHACETLIRQAARHQGAMIGVYQGIEHGACQWPRLVMHLARHLGKPPAVACKADLAVTGELGNAVQFVEHEQIAITVLQQPVHAAVKVKEREKRDKIAHC
ncbi:MAG: hypothetical protein ACK56I_12895, partial [bacterium]